MRHIIFLTGYYGSGKTEVALNLADQFKTDYLVDLDIINPYFRAREMKDQLKHTRIISSDLKDDKHSDLPYLSKDIFLPFRDPEKTAIYDLGGSDLGAKVMRQFAKEDLKQIEFFLVVNVFRPETSYKENIVLLIKELQEESGVKITGLINNTNVLNETSVNDLTYGEDILRQVCLKTNIPIIYTMVSDKIDHKTHAFTGEVITMKRFLSKI